MDLLKGPIREGSRGGRDFKWSDVKDSKDREYYLGVSVKAPTGRWQQNRDIQWYSRGQSSSAEEEALRREQRLEEIRKIKEAENDALSEALGFKVVRRVDGSGGLSQGEVDRAIKEAGAGVDEREVEGNEKGIGFGRIGVAAALAGNAGGNREVMAGNDTKDDDGVKWRPAPATAPSRESDRRDDRRRGNDREKSSRHRHRSRSKDRDRGRDRERHRRHRSRSRSRGRERRHEIDRRRRDQSRSPRRHDDRRDRRDHDRRDRDRDDRRRRHD
ncbi:uncharacterized protein DFL_007717 [Arthrobotrys flagrans]|uniref:Multiple myeloma tumor-associated protein 2-like N-terminal domain-containing protein n=1 Tax=Arthrobotrys flagrans TaxID=97331 RepID=A0A436ZX70_ARTFL|nr:hypothetical protein DFL_007717 [Arthrobotrys flagrans]